MNASPTLQRAARAFLLRLVAENGIEEAACVLRELADEIEAKRSCVRRRSLQFLSPRHPAGSIACFNLLIPKGMSQMAGFLPLVIACTIAELRIKRGTGMKGFFGLAAAALVASPMVASGVEVPGHYPTLANSTLTASEAISDAERNSFLGAPDDSFTGIGNQWITYDLGAFRLVDGAGQDLNVYEVDNGAVEFNLVDILVSANSVDFFNVESTAAGAIDLIGDNAHGSPDFRRSYDVGAAVVALGASEFRYVRLFGTSSGSIGGINGFDVDAIGLVNWVDRTPHGVPEPTSLALLGLGLAGLGLSRRRRAD